MATPRVDTEAQVQAEGWAAAQRASWLILAAGLALFVLVLAISIATGIP
jgi:hypothetical protein